MTLFPHFFTCIPRLSSGPTSSEASTAFSKP